MSTRYSFLALVSVSILLFSSCQKASKPLPIYGQREAIQVKNNDGSTEIDTIYQTIPAFSFLNQDSLPLTNKAFENKIYIADFFFTSCSTICPIMHRNMKTIFDEYKENPEVMFLSHTIDFKYDTPSKLKKYAIKLGVDGPKWQFAYGSKDSIYTLAEKNYLVAVMEDSTAKETYVHQGWLVLIDKHKRIRGAYDGTKTDQVAKLKQDIPVLLAEEQK
ncbi:MAG TPA: SCO family protein [Pedobacter sp.]|nr:SCO family protein [Pedobacter sp.]